MKKIALTIKSLFYYLKVDGDNYTVEPRYWIQVPIIIISLPLFLISLIIEYINNKFFTVHSRIMEVKRRDVSKELNRKERKSIKFSLMDNF